MEPQQPHVERALAQATARVVWGQDVQEVCLWLQQQGVPAAQAQRHVDAALTDRRREMRRRARPGLLWGSLFTTTGAVLFAAIWRLPVRPFFSLVAAVSILSVGLLRLYRGLSLYLGGSGVRGSVTDMES